MSSFTSTAKSFARELFAPSTPALRQRDYPDLTGQVWVVEGATGGIGRECALKLLQQGAKVWLLGHSPSRMEEVTEMLKRIVPQGHFETALIDFVDLSTVKPALKPLLEGEDTIQGVLHCSGVMLRSNKERTEQDHQSTVAINNIGPHLVQRLLDPLLIKSSESEGPIPRIIWISSMMSSASPEGGFHKRNLTKGSDPRNQYAVSKAIVYIQSVQWVQNHPGVRVLSLSVHPGLIDTNFEDSSSLVNALFLRPLMRQQSYASYIPLFAALSPSITFEDNGGYYVPPGVKEKMRRDIAKAARGEKGAYVWNWLNEQTNKFI